MNFLLFMTIESSQSVLSIVYTKTKGRLLTSSLVKTSNALTTPSRLTDHNVRSYLKTFSAFFW